MRLIRGLNNLPRDWAGCVATMGNFDGVHLGHQSILKQLHALAKQYGLASLVILFEPQPREFFMPQKAPARLMRLREKLECLQELNIDYVLCLRFDQAFAKLPARDFVEGVLKRLAIKHLVIGDDFRFGYQRQGDFALLKQLGQRQAMVVSDSPSCEYQGQRLSSSRIRACLAAADFTQASALLGRAYTIQGRVSHGQKLGRELGYPTINLALKRLHSPLQGIYAVRVSGLSAIALAGAASIGTRPTVNGRHVLLEVYLLDFHEEVYGKQVKVEFVQKIRDEEYFAELETLKQQMQRDVAQIEQILNC